MTKLFKSERKKTAGFHQYQSDMMSTSLFYSSYLTGCLLSSVNTPGGLARLFIREVGKCSPY